MKSKNPARGVMKRARKKAGLTQLEMAAKAQISVTHYARIERGETNPSIKLLQKIAKILNVKPAKILPFL